MGLIHVEPHSDSYTVEWVAVEVNGPEDFFAVKRLCKNSPWQITLNIDDYHILFTQVQAGVLEQWKVYFTDGWVVRSPHGKFWFMSKSEFESQFYTREGL